MTLNDLVRSILARPKGFMKALVIQESITVVYDSNQDWLSLGGTDLQALYAYGVSPFGDAIKFLQTRLRNTGAYQLEMHLYSGVSE